MALISELISANKRTYFSTARTLQLLQPNPSSRSTTWPGVQQMTKAPAERRTCQRRRQVPGSTQPLATKVLGGLGVVKWAKTKQIRFTSYFCFAENLRVEPPNTRN